MDAGVLGSAISINCTESGSAGVLLDAGIGLNHNVPPGLQVFGLEFCQLHPSPERPAADIHRTSGFLDAAMGKQSGDCRLFLAPEFFAVTGHLRTSADICASVSLGVASARQCRQPRRTPKVLKMMEQDETADGCVMSLGDDFTPEATKLAEVNEVLLMDGAKICRLLLRMMVGSVAS